MNNGIVGWGGLPNLALAKNGGREAFRSIRVSNTQPLFIQRYLSQANLIEILAESNLTIALPAAKKNANYSFTVVVLQDATGSRTITWQVPTSIKWTGGVAPTASTTASSYDAYVFFNGGHDFWFGAQVGKSYA